MALGDLDDDGYPELMVSRATYGSAELFYGDGTGTLLSAGRVGLGRTAACAAGGDFDGDGNRDLAIGDWSDDSNQGIVRVALGPISGAPTFGITIESATQEEFGYSIAAGDLDGDSIDDLVVGAPYNADGGTAAGAAFVFYGIGF